MGPSQVQKPFFVPAFVCRKKSSAFFPCVPNGKFKQQLSKEGNAETKGKQSSNRAAMGQGPGSFLGDVHSHLTHISGFYRRRGPHQVQDGNFGLSKSTWISKSRWMRFLEHQPVTANQSEEEASLVAQLVKNLPAIQETRVQFLGQEDFLEMEVATHSSILAWRIPWRGTWQAIVHGVARVGHDLATKPPPIRRQTQTLQASPKICH